MRMTYLSAYHHGLVTALCVQRRAPPPSRKASHHRSRRQRRQDYDGRDAEYDGGGAGVAVHARMTSSAASTVRTPPDMLTGGRHGRDGGADYSDSDMPEHNRHRHKARHERRDRRDHDERTR